MVRFNLDDSLDDIDEGKSFNQFIFDLLDWAEKQGKTEALIDSACRHAPRNSKIQDTYTLYRKWISEWENQSIPRPDINTQSQPEPKNSSDVFDKPQYIELKLNGSIESFTSKQQEKLLNAIRELLQINQEVRIIKIESGSVIITLELPSEKTQQFLNLVTEGALPEFDVIHARVVMNTEPQIGIGKHAELKNHIQALRDSRKLKLLNEPWIMNLNGTNGSQAQEQAFNDIANYLYVVVYKHLNSKSLNINELKKLPENDLASFAQDIVQDVVERIVRDDFALLETYSGTGKFTTWMATIALNCMESELRRLSHLSRNTRDTEAVQPIESPIQIYTFAIIQEMIAQLPDRLQTVLVRCLIDGETTKTVAEEIGISQPAISSRLIRAKKELNKLLKNQGIDTPEYLRP